MGSTLPFFNLVARASAKFPAIKSCFFGSTDLEQLTKEIAHLLDCTASLLQLLQ
jgi:hypothetical protein